MAGGEGEGALLPGMENEQGLVVEEAFEGEVEGEAGFSQGRDSKRMLASQLLVWRVLQALTFVTQDTTHRLGFLATVERFSLLRESQV